MAKATQKKKWFTIYAPKIFNEVIVGDTTAYEAEKIKGRTLKVNMSTITENIRQQSKEIMLIIDSVSGENARSSILGIRLLPNSIKRQVRKGRTRLDKTIKVLTKDEKVVQIKILAITRNLVKGSVKMGLYHELERFVIKKVSQSTFDELIEMILKERFQSELYKRLTKVYPLRMLDVKAIKHERFTKAVELRKIKVATESAKKEEPKEDIDEEITEGKTEKTV